MSSTLGTRGRCRPPFGSDLGDSATAGNHTQAQGVTPIPNGNLPNLLTEV